AACGALAHTHRIAKRVHNLSHTLHPARLQLLGLVASIEGLRREAMRPGLSITFEHDPVPAGLTPETVPCVYGLAQEALQNATNASAARRISMELRATVDHLAFTIVDDGVGFDTTQITTAGLGLVSMRERAEAIGGRLSIRSALGAGTRLEI